MTGHRRPTLRKGMIVALLAGMLAAPVGAVTAFVTSYEAEGAIYPGVSVAGVAVGRMTPEAASRHIAAVWKRNPRVLLRIGDQSISVTYEDLGLTPNTAATVQAAQAIGREGPLWRRITEAAGAMVAGRPVSPVWSVDEPVFNAAIDQIVRRVRTEPRNARLVTGANGDVRIEPHRDGMWVDAAVLRQALLTAARTGRHWVDVRAEPLRPAITADTLRAWGVDARLARFETAFNPAEKNRSHNIALAAQALDGIVIPPGAVLSFNEVVGPRTAARGYRVAPVILNGRYVDDVGGGVCQVATTLYNAALLAGASIVERRPHSLPVEYVPLGRDATVADAGVDLQFRNPFSTPLVVQAEIVANRLVIELYGSRADRRSYRLVSVVEQLPVTVREVPDASLPAGERRQREEGRPGYRVEVYRVTEGSTDRYAPVWEPIGVSYYPGKERIVAVGR